MERLFHRPRPVAPLVEDELLNFRPQPVDLTAQREQGRRTLWKLSPACFVLDMFQECCRCICADIRTRPLGIVSQPRRLLAVLFLDGRCQQFDLARGVVNQRCENLSHEFLIIQRDIPELIPIQDRSRIGYLHNSIVAGPGSLENQRNTLIERCPMRVLGRANGVLRRQTGNALPLPPTSRSEWRSP